MPPVVPPLPPAPGRALARAPGVPRSFASCVTGTPKLEWDACAASLLEFFMCCASHDGPAKLLAGEEPIATEGAPMKRLWIGALGLSLGCGLAAATAGDA